MSAEESSADQGLAAPLLSSDRDSDIAAVTSRRAIHIGTIDSPMLTLMRASLSPATVTVTVTASLAACMLLYQQAPSPRYAALALIACLLSQRAFRPLDSPLCRSQGQPAQAKLWHLLSSGTGV